jgi:hypothetical protein
VEAEWKPRRDPEPTCLEKCIASFRSFDQREKEKENKKRKLETDEVAG